MPIFECQADRCAVLLVDVQERFLSAIGSIAPDQPVGTACRTLLAGAELLGTPTLISRQYPKGLGDTLPHLREAAPSATTYDKVAFSLLDDEVLRQQLAEMDRDELIIAGIEAHICVLSTVADAIRHGYRVTVCADAVDSRVRENADWARQAMRDLGALVVPVETVLFRWQRFAEGDRFKALSRLVR